MKEEMAEPVEVKARTVKIVARMKPQRLTCFIPMELGTKFK